MSSSEQECLLGRLCSERPPTLLDGAPRCPPPAPGACEFEDLLGPQPWEERGSSVSRGREQGGAARLPWDVLMDGGAPVQEHDDADHGRGDEHLGVHAQPGEVQADLLPEVLPAPQGRGEQR